VWGLYCTVRHINTQPTFSFLLLNPGIVFGRQWASTGGRGKVRGFFYGGFYDFVFGLLPLLAFGSPKGFIIAGVQFPFWLFFFFVLARAF
jgi:hypothetical protein